jgi:hypothetical protein
MTGRIAFFQQKVHDYNWVNVTNTVAFAPRDGAGALVFDGKMWLLGGWNPRDKVNFPRICNNEVFNSQDGVHWHLVKPNTFIDDSFDSTADWEGRHTAGYVVYDGKMWIIGGDVNQGHYHYDVWNSTDGVKWNYVNKGEEARGQKGKMAGGLISLLAPLPLNPLAFLRLVFLPSCPLASLTIYGIPRMV